MICKAFPHCRRSAEPNDKFCVACRNRLDDIKRRLFPTERGKSLATVESNAKLIAAFVADQAGAVVTTKGLRAHLGLSDAAAQKASNFARQEKWIVLKAGPHGGYVGGDVEVPE